MSLTLSPSRLTFACSFFMLYCNVFVGCVWSITSKLRSETKPTISEQPDCASSFNSSCIVTSVDFWLSHDQYEQNSERELLVSLSLHDLFSRHDLTGELSLHAAIHTIFMFAEAYLALPFG